MKSLVFNKWKAYTFFAGDDIWEKLAFGAVGSFLIQVGFAALSFVNAIFLARWLGPEGYGAYSGAIAWMSLFAIPASLGFHILIVKEFAISRSEKSWGKLKGLLYFSSFLIIISSLLCSGVLYFIAQIFLTTSHGILLGEVLQVGAFILPFIVLCTLFTSGLRGLEQVIKGNSANMLIRPAILCVTLILCFNFWPKSINPISAMILNGVGAVIALIVAFYWLQNKTSPYIKDVSLEYNNKQWLGTSLPMLVYAGSQTILGQTDLVMLSAMRGTEEAGLYAVANRLAYILVFGMVAAEMVLAPIISSLYAKGKTSELQNIVVRLTKGVFFITLLFGVFFIFFGRECLGIFGVNFQLAYPAFVILVILRVVDVGLGPAALLMTMSGYERIVAHIFILMALLNIVLNLFLIFFYGFIGAAIASFISLIAVKLILLYFGFIRTGINASILQSSLLVNKYIKIKICN